MFHSRIFLLLGFFTVLIAVPITILVIQQQTKTQSHATKATTLSFAPTNPFTVGDAIKIGVYVTPNTNVISFIKLSITYDSTKLSPASSGVITDYTLALPFTLDKPTTTCGTTICTISVSMSIGTSGQPLTGSGQTLIATLNFTAIAPTDGLTPALQFDQNHTQILSISNSDQPAENVLSTANDANLVINPVPTGSPTPVVQTTPTPTPVSAESNSTSTTNTNTSSTQNTTSTTASSSSSVQNLTSSPTSTPLAPTQSLLKSIPKTGPSDMLIGAGVVGSLVTVGGLLLLAL